jgi:ATPase family associated with various cellular activities (AAA)
VTVHEAIVDLDTVGDLDAVGHLDAELHWLDAVLADAVARQRAEGRWRGDDDLRGVYVSGEVAAAVVAGRAAAPAAGRRAVNERSALDRRLRLSGGERLPLVALWERFRLDPFERFALLLALAPELDSRYRAVLGYLRDDAAAGAPTVALALDLWLGPGPCSARLRRAFSPDASLVRYRLVRLRPPSTGLSLLGHSLEVDDWPVEWVLRDGVPTSVRAKDEGAAVVVLVADDERAALDDVGDAALDVIGEGRDALVAAGREARARGLVLVVYAKTLEDDDLQLVDAFGADGLPVAVVVAAGDADRLLDHWPRRRLSATTATARSARWRDAMSNAGLVFEPCAVDVVARAHPIALDRIDAAVQRLASDSARTRRSNVKSQMLTTEDLRGAARGVARHRLAGLARRVPPGRSWDDLVLPARTLQQLREIAAAVAHRAEVLDGWGFGARAGGRGVHVLFSGPSGTGKTLAAAVIAEEAGYELYVVDVARVVDKYLGETEKHLDRVFTEAGAAGAVLLFDEADALFGQRAQVHDARDRWANLEVAYLLQRLEDHEGVTILATNLGQHLDQAFTRRIHHRVEFLMPNEPLRQRLWRVVLPPAAPLSADLDLDLVGSRFELSGGAIRNAALTAAYLAAAEHRPIALADVVRAVARELEKAGRPATRTEFRELHDALATDGAQP